YWRFMIIIWSPLLAGLVAGILGWLIGARLARDIRSLADGRAMSISLSGREVAALARALAEERIDAAARASAARSQIDRLRGVFDALPDGVIVCGPDRSLILANSAAQGMLGLTGAAADGDVIARLPPAEGRAEFRANTRALLSYSTQLAGALGSLGSVTVLHDATEEHESERLKGEFLSVVSHELQTPLAAITGATDLLLDGDPGALNAEQTRFLSAIRRNGQRLSALVSNLLDVSRLEAGRVELDCQPVDLGMLARSGVRSMANLFEQRAQTVTVNVADGVPPVLGDRQRIEQILANLLANAGQYTPVGGRIEVEVTTGPGPDGAEQVVLSVSDDGPGISQSDQARIFDEFYRGASAAARRDRGSGLGLSIVRSLVGLQGGRVWVESQPGEGARFSVALPIATEEDE
ncbi:MAG: ATP-binding protein, partial [Chloroflexota bacterium]